MQKIYSFLLAAFLFLNTYGQNNLPYPVIFVHGLAGSDETFATTMTYLRDHDNLGKINVFDIVLNADNDVDNSLMSTDVKWTDFNYGPWYDNRDINVGRRNYDPDRDNFTDGWTGSNIFAINFQEERIRGAWGTFNDYFDKSNEAGIFKQGYALGKMIQEVLNYTGAEKVVLVGHSMGGLCIREYLQRTNSSGVHTNWVDPYSADGHKVARVATYGTPHLGSNTSPDPTKAAQANDKSTIPDINGDSEANRDLLWEYDSYTNCGGLPQGIYMFGGNEYCIKSVSGNSTFDNVDINCNGSQSDDIVGINASYYSYDYNSAMPLPLNIKYTYMTSIWADWGGSLVGDGAVNIHRQWLHNSSNTPTPAGLTDTTLNDIVHTSEGSDYYNIIRGIDEPKRFDLAYKLKYNRPIIGYITFQQNLLTADDDLFKVDVAGINAVAITIDGALSGVHTIGFYDASENMLCSRPVSSFPNKLYVNVPDGASEIYIKISGTATSETWKNPYTLNVVSGSWTGTVSSDWSTSTNWTEGIADSYDDVYIPETSSYMPLVNTNADCNRMRIPANSILSVNPTASVNIHNDMILNGKIILKSDFVNTASYLDNGNISGNGTVILQRNLQSGGYHYLSSHVSDGNSDVFRLLNNGYTNPNFYFYDETVNNPDWLYGWTQATSGILQQARGYAYYGPYEQTYFELSGKPNTGDISIPVTNSGFGITSDGWNLIGNPYPSSVSALNFINLNNSGTITGAVYLWDDDYSQDYSWEDYGAFNLSGYVVGTGGGKLFNGFIAPGQGFFVKAVSDGNVIFKNSARSVNNSVFFKNNTFSDIKRLYVNLSGEDFDNNIMLAFTDNATFGIDNLYDAERIKGNTDFSFYSICEDKDLIIQALPDFNNLKTEIRLGTEINIAGKYTFKFDSLENIPNDINVYLKDSFLKKYYDLRENNQIQIYLYQGIDRNRFSLVFTKDALSINPLSDNKFSIYASGKKLYVNTSETISYRIYNINGKLLKTGTINSKTVDLNNFSTGVYFIKIISGNYTEVKKVILN